MVPVPGEGGKAQEPPFFHCVGDIGLLRRVNSPLLFLLLYGVLGRDERTAYPGERHVLESADASPKEKEPNCPKKSKYDDYYTYPRGDNASLIPLDGGGDKSVIEGPAAAIENGAFWQTGPRHFFGEKPGSLTLDDLNKLFLC